MLCLLLNQFPFFRMCLNFRCLPKRGGGKPWRIMRALVFTLRLSLSSGQALTVELLFEMFGKMSYPFAFRHRPDLLYRLVQFFATCPNSWHLKHFSSFGPALPNSPFWVRLINVTFSIRSFRENLLLLCVKFPRLPLLVHNNEGVWSDPLFFQFSSKLGSATSCRLLLWRWLAFLEGFRESFWDALLFFHFEAYSVTGTFVSSWVK